MDDLRDLQVVTEVKDENGQGMGYESVTGPIQIISNAATLQRAREVCPGSQPWTVSPAQPEPP